MFSAIHHGGAICHFGRSPFLFSKPLNNHGGVIMNRQLLEKHFSPAQIKQREGNFGKKLDYIEGHAVIQRLNDAFEAQWSFSILKHEILEATDEVVVLGELKAGDVFKTQFGSSRITRSRQSGEAVSLADDFKAAATDAVKKCATLLGVGLHLYNGDRPSKTPMPSQHTENRTHHHGNIRHKNNRPTNTNNGSANGNGRISSRQFAYIMRIADENGRNKEQLDQEAISMFGCAVQFLSKADASSFIQHLLSK
jgi:recombination DNA repair RAD52 pathway protein